MLVTGTGRDGFATHRLSWDGAGVPAPLRGAVVAIGNFDGLHRGHEAVIARAKGLAARLGRPCAVCSFEPHPADFFAGRNVLFRLTPEPAKARALQRLGVEALVVLPFDARMAALSADAFVKEVLVDRLGIAAAVVGYDFHFGRGRTGTPASLAAAGAAHGFVVDIIDRIVTDGHGTLAAVSSTAIREALARGDVEGAAALLGHDYFVVGEVVHGQKLGRTLGYPTANMRLDPASCLAHGIYAVTVTGDGLARGGVASFGRRPTVDNGAPLLETVLFDFAGDLYGRTLEVAFLAWIRGEEKFDGLAALMVAMQGDEARARAILKDRAGP